MRHAAAVPWEAIEVLTGDPVRVPLLGVVAAGARFQAFAVESVIELPPGLWNGRKVFALRVRGSSMVDEGIRDGDYLIVEPRDTADDGQTVVAEVDGGVTVKRLFRDGKGRVRLQPANREMLPLVVPADRVRVVGAVVGVFRRQGFRPPRRRETRPAPRDARTLDLTVRMIDQNLADADALAAARPGRSGRRIGELARGLRSLRDCYLATTVPRLRAALLGEAGALIRELRRFGAEPR
jgi:hypothetical protein